MEPYIVEVVALRWLNAEQTMLGADVKFSHRTGIDPMCINANYDTQLGRELWDEAMHGLHGTIAQYVEPEPVPEVAPDEISRRQFFQQLAVMEIITKTEALAALQNGTIPPPLQVIIDQLPTEDDKFNAQMLVIGAASFNRLHTLSEVVRVALDWSIGQRDEFWRSASKL